MADLSQLIATAAAKYGLDPALLAGLVQKESSGNPNAVSSEGAQGLTQLMPATAASLGVTNPFDPAQNLDGGAKYLSSLLQRYGGDVSLALAAYNAGPGNVDKYGGIPPFAETQNYVSSILTKLGVSASPPTNPSRGLQETPPSGGPQSSRPTSLEVPEDF